MVLVVVGGVAGVFLFRWRRSSLKRCPYCAEFVRRDAKVCRYCGREIG